MEDSVDRHLARWRGKAPYDERTEAIVTRMQFLVKHVRQAKDRALAQVGLQEFEFETLHRLVAHGGTMTPSHLAQELMLSPAGMTGRLDTLEQAGLVRRLRRPGDRRRVEVELTEAGHAKWLAAMRLRGDAEADMVAALDPAAQATLDDLLRRMLAKVEADAQEDPAHSKTPRLAEPDEA
ncbi:transcriptional regulator [Actinomadura rubrobrunea]|uniref:Transcriptional regulator n=1 Tax=Actinomadura rubrobrunea TaxID=115335 RepID=A0A9W6UX83_9ACTN|nr:MarR family winged helix-turn-helix transcriptional regulator [Actinomadura rubrobrunea]GLW64430.1 transcriptional regulator [Actinomadura rubrobrunea]